MFMQFHSALVSAFVVMMILAHAQDQSDFISIDCGQQQNSDYTESTTTIRYTRDTKYINTGVSMTVSREYITLQQFWFVRAFSEGIRNCYKINIKSGQKYLVRASFGYGNYDGEENLPEFELHLGTSLWDSVVFAKVNDIIIKELIHVPMRNYIHVCLVNIGKGVPFISAIELRRLRNDIYETEVGTSLAVMGRSNMALSTIIRRYPNDVHDRIWYPFVMAGWEELSSSYPIDPYQTHYELPSVVMSTAATASTYLNFPWAPKGVVDKNASYYIYMHFAEFSTSSSRELSVTINEELIDKPFYPVYLTTTTKNTTIAADKGKYDFSIYSPSTSYGPILNAIEIYMTKQFPVSETNQQDVEAITNIKSTYGIVKNWQGDPCNPQVYLWEGVKCSYSDNNSSRIISLALSSNELTGPIADSITNLTMIQTLDLSNNKLTGQIPPFLSQLPKLNTLNLEKNELTGSVPVELSAKQKDGLSLSLCGNPSLLGQLPCDKKKKNKFVIPVVVAIIVVLSISSIVAAILLWNGKDVRAAWNHKKLAKEGPRDVFLSFRGTDTRKGFTHNLYEALCTNGIKTFIDDEKLDTGEEIGPSLIAAIEAAKISVIVLSKNYTSSSWCLDELVKILDRKKTKKQYVYPIFYEVTPANVRYQSGTCNLEGQVKHNKEKIPTWEAALKEVANLSGVTYPDGQYRNEAEAIKDIVKKISKKLKKSKSKMCFSISLT